LESLVHNIEVIKGKVRAKKRVFAVWTIFRQGDKWALYNCPDCRNPIAKYKGDLVMEVPGEFLSDYPVMIQCKNPKCGRTITFVGAVEQL